MQDEGSQLLGAAVGARPGETVLDLCAGAGGKTLLLAADVGARRAGCTPPIPTASGSRGCGVRAARAGAAGIVAVEGAAPAADLVVDRVLVDAPCSELGALRRGPDLRWRLDPATFAALPALQLGILARGAAPRAPGRHARLRDVHLPARGGRGRRPRVRGGAPRLRAASRPRSIAAALGPEGFLRTFPHRHGTDGFFAARWARRP